MNGARSSRRKPQGPPRQQAASSFTTILERLVAATPSARGAALVDFEGETVDYAGHLDPFEMKVAAATFQIVLSELEESVFAGSSQITVRAQRSSFVLRRVNHEYTIVLVLHARASFAVSERALVEAETALAHEAGLPRKHRHTWFGVAVRDAAEHRPVELCVAGAWEPIEVMGALMDLPDRERGFRIRLGSGAEMMLVRERTGLWFSDEPINEIAAHRRS